ncbi:FAD-binding oxidoreductase [Streptomyces sp. NPDC059874]|uniref:FAD-binding oxidoreductase n=1 Tax=Streptomyces sp. NPDC059874 TaxID=3346983 RepID=UPI0036475692
MTRLTDHAVGSLRERIRGDVLGPEHPEYDTARSVANGAIDHRPALLVRCAEPADVAAALSFARDEHLEVSVRGGGHNPAGAAVCPDGLVVDLTAMHAVTVDPEARTARCGGGATLAQLDAATQAHGLAVPAGTISHTGVGGLTLGGGMGWLTRQHGLTVDNLLGAEVVLANGTLVHASAEENPDLFWALRGGGGNFGVVTAFDFGLHAVGPEVHVGVFFWDMSVGREALELIRDVVPALPPRHSVLVGIGLNAPPEPFVPVEDRGKLGHALIIGGFGSVEEHAAAAALLDGGPPRLFEMRTSLPYTHLQSMLDDSSPYGILDYEKGILIPELSDDVIALLNEYLRRKTSPLTFCPTFRLDGAFTEVDEDATAYGSPREPGYQMALTALSFDPEELVADTAWVRALWTELLPHAVGPGGYVNFMTEIEEDRVRASYGAEKYQRLARIKSKYDPENVFHRNANVAPVAA